MSDLHVCLTLTLTPSEGGEYEDIEPLYQYEEVLPQDRAHRTNNVIDMIIVLTINVTMSVYRILMYMCFCFSAPLGKPVDIVNHISWTRQEVIENDMHEKMWITQHCRL